jgi:predicted nucleic-acid-binding protein
MKALNTNCLVRFLVGDDPKQSARVLELFRDAEKERARFRVLLVVVLELLWVLDSVYEISRDGILDGLENLLRLPVLEFERRDSVLSLIRRGRDEEGLDLPDLLIGLAAHDSGCESTVTFDRRTGRSELFEMA